jgi:hypothetical protein
VKSSFNNAGAGALWSRIEPQHRLEPEPEPRLRPLQLRSYVQQQKKHFQNCTKSSAAALCLRGSRLRLRVKILMRLWRLRSRITFSPAFLMRLRNTCFFLIVLFWTSGLAPELHFFTAPAAVKGCGSGRTERMRLRLPWKSVAPALQRWFKE